MGNVHRFAHQIYHNIVLNPGADPRAIGAAVTMALCGHWEHDGSCRWPHHTGFTDRSDGTLDLLIEFDCAATDEATVRSRIADAIASGELTGPDGITCHWSVVPSAT